ncbi:MAG: LPS export ABC transporter periplasmic protein LptC [Rhodospirillales bacterium]|nr:LPS export ABC transporter periplasmic protein LptC [Rhodospirillales bacterium]MDE2199251.1 LPS export ABC transporter periplasmic protein LptC [Rhodospirillales bacterium]MDE2575426.1 LPS export ABC transporter periplasmic protein LptC [Rhodospirillales bacterium]
MSVARLPLGHGTHAPPSARVLARRRRLVGLAKRVLPLVALALMVLVALWPELSRQTDRARLAYQRAGIQPEAGQLTDARYHGNDQDGEPFTITAATARQVGLDRIDMTAPKGDLDLDSGNWMLGQAAHGVYMQKTGVLDLSGEVMLYRDDGTTLRTDSATIDLHQGAAAGSAMTHIEGPLGTLDAQGFTVTDRGTTIRFTGPGRLVLNGAQR